MKGLQEYINARKEWKRRLQREPTAWNEERKQYIQLLANGDYEDFLLVANDDIPLWSSFFTFVPNYGLKLNLYENFTQQVYLAETEAFWRNLISLREGVPWGATRLYDADILGSFGDYRFPKFRAFNQLSKDKTHLRNVLANISLEQVPIQMSSTHNISMCRYEVTQVLYEQYAGDPSEFKGSTRPVENVSWYDAIEFCNVLSEESGLQPCYIIQGTEVKLKKSANGYRLPTEAEWEYCARGGENFKYAGSDVLNRVGWYDENSDWKTHPVGQKKANAFGLYDMSGNVNEWCQGFSERGRKAVRGGSWNYPYRYAQVSGRLSILASYRYDMLGFRICRNLG